MRLLNVRGAKAPQRVLIPASDGSVPFRRRDRATLAERGAVCRAPHLFPRAVASCHSAAAAAVIAAAGAGSSPRPTISSLTDERIRQRGALGVTLWSKAAELGRIQESFGG
jgi:hypothetical protein